MSKKNPDNKPKQQAFCALDKGKETWTPKQEAGQHESTSKHILMSFAPTGTL